MTNEELTKLVQKISLKYFQRSFKNKAFFNSRLRTTGGRFHLKSEDIDINPKILEVYDETILVGVIKHELCHYHLYQQNLDSNHRSYQFKKLLRDVNGLRYVPVLNKRNYKIYKCSNCNQEYKRVKKLNIRRYACGKCGKKLVFDREEYSY